MIETFSTIEPLHILAARQDETMAMEKQGIGEKKRKRED